MEVIQVVLVSGALLVLGELRSEGLIVDVCLVLADTVEEAVDTSTVDDCSTTSVQTGGATVLGVVDSCGDGGEDVVSGCVSLSETVGVVVEGVCVLTTTGRVEVNLVIGPVCGAVEGLVKTTVLERGEEAAVLEVTADVDCGEEGVGGFNTTGMLMPETRRYNNITTLQ